jgi:hypothetical protein
MAHRKHGSSWTSRQSLFSPFGLPIGSLLQMSNLRRNFETLFCLKLKVCVPSHWAPSSAQRSIRLSAVGQSITRTVSYFELIVISEPINQLHLLFAVLASVHAINSRPVLTTYPHLHTMVSVCTRPCTERIPLLSYSAALRPKSLRFFV